MLHEFTNHGQGNLYVKAYSFKFTQLCRYAPTIFVGPRENMSKFVLRVSKWVFNEWCISMPIIDKEISRLIGEAQKI